MQRRSTSVAAIAVAWVVAAQLASTGSVEAQLFDRALVIRNARIVTMAGPVIERGSILIKGGRIAAIGPEVDAPFFSRTIDADGKTVTPGLIDAWSSLGRLNGSRGSADPTASAWDAFDRFDRDSFRQALRNGVTTIYVGPTGGPGIAGTGVVVRLAPEPGGKAGKLIEEHAALAVNFGSSQNAIARAKTYLAIRKQFRTALDYRQALEDYEEDLKEYIEKLEERREEKEKEEAKEKKEGDEDGEKEEDTPPEDSPKPEPKPTPKPEPEPDDNGDRVRGRTLTSSADADRRLNEENGDEEGSEDGDEKEADEEGDEEKEEELTKPTRPTPDRASEALLRAIDHELPLRIEAHRSEDILNALQLAKEFRLDIILEGATDAYLLADKLSEADVPVVLGPIVRTPLFEHNEHRRHTPRSAAVLEEAGVLWTTGSGGDDPMASRFVGLNAQLAAGHGATQMPWLATVTTNAAKILNLADRLGQLRRGLDADLVIWTGDPREASSTVERTIVGGAVVYTAPSAKSQGGGS